MTRKSKARYGLNRTYKISPTVKALRSALFLGLATAAAAPAAQAGVCVNVVNDVICAGDFNSTLDSWDGNELAVVNPFDPTTIELDANVTVYDQDGVFAWNFDDLSLQNDGNVIAEGGGSSLGKMVGIYAEASGGSLDFTNNGWVIADKDDTYWYAGGVAVGVELQADYGITAVNNGLIAGHAVDDNALGLFARNYDSGAIHITNGVDGDIVADSDWRSATGISADNWGGDLTVINDGRVAAEAGNWAIGIDTHAYSGDVNVSVGVTGEVEVNGWTASGIRASSGDFNAISVVNAGSIDVTGAYAEGVSVYGDYRNAVNVGNYGELVVEGFSSALGVNINGEGIDARVDNFGVIAAYGGDFGNIAVNVNTQNGPNYGYGSIAVHNGGIITAGSKYNAGSNESFGDSYGVRAFSDGDITVTNVGDYGSPAGILAATQNGDAFAIRAISDGGDVSISNGDALSKYSVVAAISDSDYGSAYGVQVAAIYAEALSGAVDIHNSGFVLAANGNYGSAVGIRAEASGGAFLPFAVYSSPGDIDVVNNGVVYAIAYSGNATGIDADSNVGDITIGNGGAIIARAGNGTATGIDASTSKYGNVSIGNTGQIDVRGEYGAQGVHASTEYGSIDVTNNVQFDSYGDAIAGTGAITARVETSGSATGIWAYVFDDAADGDLTVSNGEGATVFATTPNGDATGIWAYNDGDGDTVIGNNGLVVAIAGGDYGDAVGIWAIASGDGLVSVSNTGAIYAETTGQNGNAIGIYAEAAGYGSISVTNGADGLIAAYADGNDGDAFGIAAVMNGTGTITVTNSGRIGVYSEGDQNGDAWGIRAMADDQGSEYAGAITVTNSGLIDVYADEDSWGVRVDTYGTGGDITVTNSGAIDVSVDDDDAFGIDAATYYGYAGITVTNSGNILVVGDDNATGIDGSVNGYGDLIVGNSGLIDVFARGDDAYGMELGLDAEFGDYVLTVTNTGVVLAESDYGDAFGIKAETYADGDLTITNTAVLDGYGDLIGGVIVADSNADYGTAWGIDAESGAGAIDVNNSGTVAAEAEYAFGINVLTYGSENATAANSGDVYAFGGNDAYAINVRTYSNGDAVVTNSGFVQAVAGEDYASGIYASSWDGTGSVSVTNTATGEIVSIGVDDATGIAAWADEGSSTVTNSGDVYAFAHGWTAGIAAQSSDSLVSVTNAAGGQVVAANTQVWNENANGIIVWSGYGALVSNAGLVSAYSEGSTAAGVYTSTWDGAGITVTNAASGDVVAEGDYGSAFGMDLRAIAGNILVTNNGDVQAASVDGEATGISAVSDYGDVVVTGTTGNVTAISTNDSATGIYAYADDSYSFGDVSVTTGGLISVSGTSADGIYAYNNGFGDVSVTNLAGGRIVVVATDGDATGISAQADSNKYGNATVTNSGSITVTSNGDSGDAYGMYVESDGYGDIGITSTGAITVTANGDSGDAFGIYAQHEDYGDVVIASGSTITVNANGDYGDAFGISAVSYSDSSISITNTGNLRANANGYGGDAFGIYSESFGNDTSIGNSGNIRATSADGSAWAIYHRGGDVAITNAATGNIFGVIQTDDGDDTFTNSGDWYATEGDNKYSSFSSGDDSVVNNTGARIFMEDSWIDMGAASAYGSNSFLNNGKIFVDGKYNVIDMGTANSVFTNNGASLHFEDGAADDQLTIFGDFAGTGRIVVDADGTSMLADRLYIDGDVITNTANVIDVFMDAYPSLQDMVDGEEIDVVHVSGTSAAANFNLGNVNVAEDALFTVDVTLNKHINYSGTNDLFSLGFEVSGLSPSGVAATSIAPAVQSLWHLGVGTVFQRQGSSRDGKSGQAGNGFMSGFKDFSNNAMQVADYQGASGVWMRAFTEDGQVSPDADRNFGMGGDQGFDLKNTGFEFGAGYAFNPQWTAGLLGGTSESTLRPADGGRAKVDADTFGAYVTYTPGNGFYADFSYRTMDFDGNGNAGGDDFSFKGDADGYSLEMGYGFKTASGLVVEPQFQYSKMDVNLDALDYAQGDFELTDGNSSQWRAGVALRKTFQTGSGEWTPYGSLSVINETDAGNSYLIGGVLTGNVDTSGNSTLLEAGATVHYGRMVFSGGVNWKDGGAYDSLFGGQVSVRFTW